MPAGSFGTRLVDLTDCTGYQTAVIVYGQGFFPILTKTPDERAVVVLRGGGGHYNVNGRLDMLISDDGLRWYGKRTAVDTCVDDRNPAFGITPSGRFLLGFHFQAGYTGEGAWHGQWDLSLNLQVYSDDEGLHWSPYQNLRVGPIVSTSPYGRIIRLSDGSYVQNVYGLPVTNSPADIAAADTVALCSYLVRSTDDGATWGDATLIATSHNETALLETSPGHILAAARHDSRHLDLLRSDDNGRNWAYATRLTAENQHPADLVDIGDGTILLLFGNRTEDKDIRGILSRDGGATWDTATHLRFTKPASGDFGYPSAVRMGDNLLIANYWSGDPENWFDGSLAQGRATRLPVEAVLECDTRG